MAVEYVYSYMHPEHGWVYIGRTNNLESRINSHNKNKSDNISREYEDLLNECSIFYLEFSSKPQGIASEAYLIEKYKPLLNKAGKTECNCEFKIDFNTKWKIYNKGNSEKELKDSILNKQSELSRLEKQISDLENEKEKLIKANEDISGKLHSFNSAISNIPCTYIYPNKPIRINNFSKYEISTEDIETFYNEYKDSDIVFELTVYDVDYKKHTIKINNSYDFKPLGNRMHIDLYQSFTNPIPSSINYYLLMYNFFNMTLLLLELRKNDTGFPVKYKEIKSDKWYRDKKYNIDVRFENGSLAAIENRKLHEPHSDMNKVWFYPSGHTAQKYYETIRFAMIDNPYIKEPKDTKYLAQEYFDYYLNHASDIVVFDYERSNDDYLQEHNKILKKLNYYKKICMELNLLENVTELN